MSRTSDKRERLIDAAKSLIHEQGFHCTTLADIAEKSKVPLGNVYYYFKTKEDICEAVIEQHKQFMLQTFEKFCNSSEPKENLKKFLKYLMKDSEKKAECGCEMGSLCQELDKTPSSLTNSADSCMQELIRWGNKQFKALGYKNSDEMAFEMMARIQGTILLGNALHEPKRIKRQLRSTCEWIDSL